MRKVNSTSFISECLTSNAKLASWLLVSFFVFIGMTNVSAQALNCTNINAGIGSNDTAIITVQEFVTNIGMDSVDVEITGVYGQRIYYEEDLTAMDSIVLAACRYIGQTLKLNVNLANRGTSCWSYLTFKQGNGPFIMGRSKTVYCLDPLVDGGHVHGTPPVAMVPCEDDVEASFVADWPIAFDCIADSLGTGSTVNDTAKIILREYEAFDKYGVRGSGYDTIYVLRLPEIIDSVNTWCRERDTLYCGHGSPLGPYMVLQDTSFGDPTEFFDCDPIFFVESEYDQESKELIFKPAYFDPKCGVHVHVDAWKFDSDECSETYKVEVEIKQTCYGLAANIMDDCDAVDFTESFHPVQWDYSRTGSDANIQWTNGSSATVFSSSGLIDINDLKDLMGIDELYVYGEDGDDAEACNVIPQDGVIDFTYDADTDEDGDIVGYSINDWEFELTGTGAINLSVRAGDRLCFFARSVANGDAELTIENFTYASNPPETNLDSLGPGYYKCTFWVINLDTIPPVIECEFPKENQDQDLVDGDTLLVPSSTHDCAAHTYIPPARVTDDWAGVKYVKAIIEGITTAVLTPSEDDPDLYESHQTVKIPHGLAVPVYYEAYDSCHNMAADTCWIKVKDLTKPVPICDKGVTVSLSSKKVWVDAETFDEGSWDNCAINFLLARRSDWYEATGCIDLCDDIDPVCWNDHYDTIYTANLEEDKHIDEVEAHYYKTIKWLKEDGRECADLLWNAWNYDLLKHATLKCVEHPYEVDDHYFKKLLLETPGCEDAFDGLTDITEEDIDLWDQLGGGWSDGVPFSCEDACKEVTVELLVMDYWCNWSKCWTKVWVEDKTPIEIEKDVEDQLEISCEAYKDKKYYYPGASHPVSVQEIVDYAKTGDEVALGELDKLFGGYEKVWRDEYGNTPECTDALYWTTRCTTETMEKKIKIYDEHLGYEWKTIEYDTTYLVKDSVENNYGQVVVNCSEGIVCEQDVWCDFDHCGQGYIYRKWKFIPGCKDLDEYWEGKVNHRYDTITRKQVIWVGNNCEIKKSMFTHPEDTEVYTCGLEYDEMGNVTGDLSPENTGQVIYNFDDDCRIIGIGYQDKVFKVVGGDEGCYKIIRKWHLMDWCYYGGKAEDDFWWLDPEYEGKVIDWEQKIIVRDTTPPVCTFETDLDTVEGSGCEYQLIQQVNVENDCGAITYEYFLEDSETGEVTASGSGEIAQEDSSFTIQIDDILPGYYKLKVRLTDECQNESYCKDEFHVKAGKKPTAICITSLTAELTPWDSDGDNVADTAHATVWASEFNISSAAACGSEGDLEFRIECIDGIDDDTWEEDTTILTVGCSDVGTKMVRLWVIDPSGTADFCDVFLLVQNNMGGCGDISSDAGIIAGTIKTEMDETIEQVSVDAFIDNGNQLQFVTSASGAYSFAAVTGQEVKVVPTKNTLQMNGISTIDLVLIQKHILGTEDLGSVYKEIAADANADGKVSAIDMIEIRRLILGKVDEFANNNSWRFFDETMSEQQTVTAADVGSIINLNWTGVKIGDVNLSGDPKRSRNALTTTFAVNDREMKAGNQYLIEVSADEFKSLLGYQFTMKFDEQSIEVVGVDKDGVLDLSDEHFSLRHADQGIVTTSWNGTEPISLESGDQVFNVVVRAIKDVQLSDAMAITSTLTSAESYMNDGSIANVALTFNSADEQGFVLYQNQPNPFDQYTVVGFNLPEAGNIQFSIFDARGKSVYTLSDNFQAGYNELRIDNNDISTTGVLYYKLETEHFNGMKKMIRVQ